MKRSYIFLFIISFIQIDLFAQNSEIPNYSEVRLIKNYTIQKDIDKKSLIGSGVVSKSLSSAEVYQNIDKDRLKGKTGNGLLEIFFETGDTLKYQGSFKNDLFHGKGILQDTRNNFIYKGNFVEGKIEGEGKLYYNEGSSYKGYLVDGKYNGRGRFKYPSDSKYLYYYGMWKNNKWNGKGMLKYKDGSIYYGGFQNGKLHGNGKMIFADGSSFEGYFRLGKPMKANNISLAEK